MTKILEMMGNPNSSDAENALAALVEDNQNKYKRLGFSNMKQWVAKNLSDILKMPEANKVEIQARHIELYKEELPDLPV